MVLHVILLMGIIFSLGFLGRFVFKRTHIADSLLLIIFGVVLGPISHFIDPSYLIDTTSILAAIAFLLILFEAGMNLKLQNVLVDSPKAVLFGFFNILISILTTVFYTSLILKWDLIYGILMGTIIGGTSSFIVLPIVQKIGVSEKIVSLLKLETMFTDVIVIVLTTTFLDAFTSVNVEYLEMVLSFISTLSIGAILGIMFGVLWLKVLNYLEDEDYNSVLTLSVTFLLYGITELVGGNGVMFVLFYSLILGNGVEIRNVLRMKETREIDDIMRNIIPLINFFIRTYFFFYLGLILFIENVNIIVHGIVICVLLLLGRYMGIQLISLNDSEIRSNQNTLSYIMPRGVTTAIIAILVTQTIPNSAAILNIVIIVIIVSLFISSIGRFMIVRRKVDD